ncbi:MAG: GNAT family N-acetyltransferase [Dehalococcoidales bacterium]|nr:GNAT family N-acetyltransferase [Dehalococcoidales bacterium]
MNNFLYKIRNYQPADFNKFILLQIEAEKLEPTGRCLSLQAISEQLNRPNHCPIMDLFVAEANNKIIGYLDITHEIIIGRVIFDCWVHPAYRNRGIATRLFKCAFNRAKNLQSKVAHVFTTEDNDINKRMLCKMDYEPIRHFLTLRVRISDINFSEIAQVNIECHHLQRGEEEKLTQIQNLTFAEHWGYNPNTVEDINYQIYSSTNSPDNIMVIRGNDKFIGYCWTKIACEGSTFSKIKGLIFMLGVNPNYRERGIGKRILLLALAHLKSKNLHFAELTMDSENKKAGILYHNVGFKVCARNLWYERIINQDTEAK